MSRPNWARRYLRWCRSPTLLLAVLWRQERLRLLR
jgi:hypothetical protein